MRYNQNGSSVFTVVILLQYYLGENPVCRFYDSVKRSREGEKEKDSIYIQRIMRENFDASPLSHLPPDM
jgi:hypothetical protein